MSKPRKPRQRPKQERPQNGSLEDIPVEAMMVAWTASVMSVFMADLATIAAHFYARFHPDSKTAAPFAAIMLLTAAFLGLASLALLVVAWRTSHLKPPTGFAAFAALVAATPLLVLAIRFMGQ